MYLCAELVIDLVTMDPPYDIFVKVIDLSKALLHGGNDEVPNLQI
jgi:hypothetical protein